VVSVAGHQGHVPIGQAKKVDNYSQTHSRSPKCTGGQAVQIGTDSANGMEPPSGGGQPAVHEMGNRDNKKCPTFVSPYSDPQAVGTDALSISWEGMSGYAYPPQAILNKVHQKIAQTKIFHGKKCEMRTIRGYRMAIAGALKISGRNNMGKCEELSDLLKSLEKDRLTRVNAIPKWDLTFILWSLAFPPFKPISVIPSSY